MTTVLDVQRFKDEGRRFAMLTAYDYLTARILDEAGIPILLVGDSLGMVMLGHPTTLPVTMDDMLHHAKAVSRGARQAAPRSRQRLAHGARRVGMQSGAVTHQHALRLDVPQRLRWNKPQHRMHADPLAGHAEDRARPEDVGANQGARLGLPQRDLVPEAVAADR